MIFQANLKQIDDLQMEELETEQVESQKFQRSFLNTVRVLVKVYSGLLYKEDFIMLPGDEIVEKKHMNIKQLTALAEGNDLAKKPQRTWPGLGKHPFEIDYTNFDAYKDLKPKEEGQPAAA